MKTKHIGISANRLSPAADNPREVAFAAQWSNEQEENRTLAHLIGKDFTDREAQVAATIIQWLGSNVGMRFLEETMKREPEIGKWLQMRGSTKSGG